MHDSEQSAVPGGGRGGPVTAIPPGWNAFASIAILLCVPIIFWIGVISTAGAMFDFAVAPWMRSAVIVVAVAVIVPVWSGLWLGRRT